MKFYAQGKQRKLLLDEVCSEHTEYKIEDPSTKDKNVKREIF